MNNSRYDGPTWNVVELITCCGGKKDETVKCLMVSM